MRQPLAASSQPVLLPGRQTSSEHLAALTETTSLFTLLMIASGVPRGAMMAYQAMAEKPGKAVSETVGTFGSCAARSVEQTAKILMVPAWCWARDDERLSKKAST